MLGTIVNTCTILTGSFVGSFLSRGISEKYKTALFDALGAGNGWAWRQRRCA